MNKALGKPLAAVFSQLRRPFPCATSIQHQRRANTTDCRRPLLSSLLQSVLSTPNQPSCPPSRPVFHDTLLFGAEVPQDNGTNLFRQHQTHHFKDTNLLGISFPYFEEAVRQQFHAKKPAECVHLLREAIAHGNTTMPLYKKACSPLIPFLFIHEKLLLHIVELCVRQKQMDLALEVLVYVQTQWRYAQHTIGSRNIDSKEAVSPYHRAWRAYQQKCPKAAPLTAAQSTAALLPRQWTPSPFALPSSLLPPASMPSEKSITVMTFNILADNLCRYLPQKDITQLHPTAASPSAFDYFDWETYRRELIVAEIRRWNCDIVCLQEVDTNHLDWLKKALAETCGLNECVFSPRVRKNRRLCPDGQATFFNSSKWKLVESHNVDFSDASIAAGQCQVTSLESVGNDGLYGLVVSNIHTQPSNDYSRLGRCIQVDSSLNSSAKKLKQMKSDRVVGRIMAGDWNCLMSKDRQHFEQNGYIYPFEHRTVSPDFLMCHADTLTPLEFASMPETRLNTPSPQYPSDHISFVARFQILDQE